MAYLGKYLLFGVVLAAVALGVFWLAPTPSAQAACPAGTTPHTAGSGVWCRDNATGVVSQYDASGKPVTTDDLGCLSGGNGLNLSLCLCGIVYIFTVGLGGGLAYIGAYLFDTTVSLALNSVAYGLDFISFGWTAVRDIANMAFILILVYIAFKIMFEAETANTMSMLAWVIFIALIINFSFFCYNNLCKC